MSDERGRRARLQTARRYGGTCANCDRVLAEGEPVWMERLEVGDVRPADFYRAPVGRECASPAFVRETEGRAPEPCASCGRGVYYAHADARRTLVLCSRRCRNHRDNARRKGGRS